MNDSPSAEQLPEVGGRYWVQCDNFMYMAVFYKDGEWKSFSNGRELPDVINYFAI
jgi:hypothetical protein